ncbi:caspase family protein, partial [bacterium]|nr:caspase family protein [bacterium]
MLRKVFSILTGCLFLLAILSVADAAIIEKSGNVSGETWVGGNTYHVVGNLTVNDGTTLTIEADSVVKFNPDLQLTVYGTLDVNGTDVSNVVFTSRDDNDFGETVPGSDGLPSPGDWYGIFLSGAGNSDGIGKFDWCLIRYGGNTANLDANVYFHSSDSGYFTNSITEYSAYYGAWVSACSPRFRGSRIENNTKYGIYINGSPDLGANNPEDKGNNVFRDNDSGNYQVYNDTSNTINAYYNFWVYTIAPDIDARIYDNDEHPGKGEVFFEPWLDDDPSLPITHYWAVIAGVADYPGTGNDLDYPDDDAIDIKNSLLLYENWEDDNIQLLLDSEATKANIQTAIETMENMADSDDVCLLFFSGHGTNGIDVNPIDESDGLDEYICAHDANIRDDELSDWLGNLSTTNVVVIVDTCFSGGQIKVVDGFTPKVLPGTTGIV